MHEYTCRLTFEQDVGETEMPPTLTAHCSTYVYVERNYVIDVSITLQKGMKLLKSYST